MKVKGRKSYKYKAPSPCRPNWMLCAIIRCQDAVICRSTKFKSVLLHFNEINIDNNYLSTNSEYDDQSGLNFPLQFFCNQVSSTTNLLDDVVSTKVDQSKNQGVYAHTDWYWRKLEAKRNHSFKTTN